MTTIVQVVIGIRDGGAQECHAHILVITTSPPLGLFGPENATTTTTSPPKKTTKKKPTKI